MASIKVDLADAAGLFNNINQSMLKAARVGLVKAAERGVQKIVVEIIPSRSPQPVDRATYKAGWKTEQVDEDTVAILNPEPHAPFIEFGVRSKNVRIGAAMIRALSEWSLRKGLANDDKAAVGVAWAIAKTMQRKGIFSRRSGGGLRILEELVQEHLNGIVRNEVSREVQLAVDRAR